MIKEKMIVEDGKLHITKEQNVSPMLDAIHNIREHLPDAHGDAKGRWVGSIPLVLAEQWCMESGAQIGTQEYAAYVKRKLMDPDYKRLVIKGY
jgi:hypothetical protein